MVYQLIYHSRFSSAAQGPSATIRNILSRSQANNFRDGITGFLIFDKSSFVQILEGDEAAVLETYDRIGSDRRHSQLTVIDSRQVGQRAFPDWAMGGYVRSPESADVYARHSPSEGFDPRALTADAVVALAQDLLAFEQARLSQRILDA